MPHPVSVGSQHPSGRQRVLEAATSLFSRASFAEVGMRDLAAAAGVDVAYVNRAYGSKAELFKAALLELMKIEELFADPTSTEQLIERLCDVITPGAPADASQARTLDIILKSCTSAEPRELLRQAVEQHFVGSLTRMLGEREKTAVMFITCFLFGTAMMRTALEVEPIKSMPDSELKSVSAELFQRILERRIEPQAVDR